MILKNIGCKKQKNDIFDILLAQQNVKVMTLNRMSKTSFFSQKWPPQDPHSESVVGRTTFAGAFGGVTWQVDSTSLLDKLWLVC